MPQQPKFKDCVWDSAKDPCTSFRTWLCVFGGIVANYNVGPQLERFLDLFLVRDPRAATTQPSFLSDPRLAFTSGPSSAHARGSNVTCHPSPLSMGGRSEATGETLGSEARRLGACCNWGGVVARLTWGLGGWDGVMFSLRIGIGGRNLVGGGLRNEFFCIAKKILVSGAYVRTRQRAQGARRAQRLLFFAQGRWQG